MKVVRIITRMNIGGPSVHAMLLSTRLDPRRFSTCLIVGVADATEGDLSASVQGAAVRVVRLASLRRSIHPWNDALTLAALVRCLWVERPQIIHTHMAKAGTLGRLAGMIYNRFGPGRRPGTRAVLIHTFHGHVLNGYFAPWLGRCFLAVERWLGARTDRLIAVSRTIRDDLVHKGIGRPEQWQVIPLGLDLADLTSCPPPNGTSPVRVGMVGRLVPIKNPGLFLEALHHLALRGSGPSMTGVLIGDGPLRQELEQQARALGLDALVQFAGWRRDIRAVYEGLEVVCLTSWNEGTPVALIEAMAAGRPVIATDVGGVRDLLDEEPSPGSRDVPASPRVASRGILVRPGDAEGLADALRMVATDERLRRRLADAGRAYVRDRFTHDRLVRNITALYGAMSGGKQT